jgi:predicted metalloenzyme YecM
MVPGKLECTIKITQLPAEAEVSTDKHGWKHFHIDCEGHSVLVALRPRMFQKITEAAKQWPLWLAAITGRMGQVQGQGFQLEEPSVQVFERKARVAPPAPDAPPQ